MPRIARIASLALVTVAASLPAQNPPQNPAQNPSAPQHHGPPDNFLLPHPNIHPPRGKVPAADAPVEFDATSMGSPLVLDRNWRLGIAPGTDPAEPGFDDSKWPVRNAKEALAEIDDSAADDTDNDSGRPGARGRDSAGPGQNDGQHEHHPHDHPFAWFRIHVHLPAHHGPLVVLVRVPVSRSTQLVPSTTVGMDLFVNGKLVVPEGRVGPTPQTFQQISRIYPLDIAPDDSSVVLAVRIPFAAFGVDAYTGFFSRRTFFLGQREDLVEHLNL